ncbi:MAG: VWA domain-containing protein [Crocosphaera sp.]|nr:VWA domain-containing protein [Crocosphaera sp.]
MDMPIDGPSDPPIGMIVKFYREHGGNEDDLVQRQDLPWLFAEGQTVTFNSPATPIKEIVMRTQAPENSLFWIEFYETVADIGHDIALALDGSGSMAAQNKWQSMIEAADILHDLYKVMGNESEDRLGAVRFRWSCADSSPLGNKIVEQPPLSALSTVDLPSLYATDAPSECTPIGEGIRRAAGMVNSGANPAKHLILFTDGKNNRGASVNTVSSDPILDPLTIHAIGLGSGVHIDPSEISVLASEHGGSYRETTDPSEILDFFVQILGETLDKAEIADVYGTRSVTIHDGTDKAIFLIAWEDPTVTHDFDLRAPDGTIIDHAATPTYHPKVSALVSHAYFVLEGSLGGTWQFVNVPSDPKIRYLAVEDLGLKIKWDITPILGFTGRPIVITAQITLNGEPYRGEVNVTAQVRRPDEAQGDLIAREVRKNQQVKAVTTSAAVRPSADTSQRSQVISSVLSRYERNDFLFTNMRELRFEKVEDGLYRLNFSQTQYDGTYRFDLKARGDNFARRNTLCAVLVTRVDAVRSSIQMSKVEQNLYKATITPMSRAGVFLGPFYADKIKLVSTQARPISSLKDNLDGSYTQLFATDGEAPTDLGLEILGTTIPLQKHSNLILWIIIILLSILVILLFLYIALS